MTLEEAKQKFNTKEELRNYIDSLKEKSLRNNNSQQAIKLMINSIYGAFANQYFHWYSVDIAESVTLQGQDAIKYTEKMIEKYFKDFWPNDVELHELMGLTKVEPLTKPVWVYTDTDSGYITFEECIEKSDWKGGVKEFALLIDKYRLKSYVKIVLNAYAKERNTDSYLDFELETIAASAIWVAKKKYVQNIVWKDGKDYEPLTNISTKGLEIIQSSTPSFCRKKLTDLVKFIFAHDEIKSDELIKVLKEVKNEFKLADIEKISMNKRVGNYSKFILNDTSQMEINKGCPIHVRAAGYHNYLLNNSKFKGKYQLVKTGDKVRFYHANDSFNDTFAYIAGSYPYEFSPPMDYEKQFEKTILEPLNRIIVPAGIRKLNRNLVYTIALF